DAAEALVAEIARAGGRAIAQAADVADVSAVEAMVARTEAELGPVTILVNNAGVSWQGTLETYDREQVARMRQVNVDGVIHVTRAVMGSMRARRYGRIVNVSSIAARAVLAKREMRSGVVMVSKIARQHAAQMALVEDDDVIQAFPADRTDQTLNIRVLPRRSRRSDNFRDPHRSDAMAECRTIGFVAVP